jgi:hypothetical protein
MKKAGPRYPAGAQHCASKVVTRAHLIIAISACVSEVYYLPEPAL